jgi:hypothetical protein
MENTMVDTRPRFARLTEGSATQSWKAAAPAVAVVVAFAGLLVYLASALSSADHRAVAAERESAQIRESQVGITKQISLLQKDAALAKAPGRTTVIVESPDGKKAKDGAAWAAVVWGELPDGKSFMRVNAYGLGEKANGSYHAWMQPQTGEPIDLGQLDIDQSGSGYAMTTELPALDQGKQVMLTVDAPGSKQPGDVLAKADLPVLKPTMSAASTEAETPQADAPQAKSGSDTQKMHQEKPGK